MRAVSLVLAGVLGLAGCGGGGGDPPPTPVSDFPVRQAYDAMVKFTGAITVRVNGPGGTASLSLNARPGNPGSFSGVPATNLVRAFSLTAPTGNASLNEVRWFSSDGTWLGWSDGVDTTTLRLGPPLPLAAARGTSGQVGTTVSITPTFGSPIQATGEVRWALSDGTDPSNATLCEVVVNRTGQGTEVGTLQLCAVINGAGIPLAWRVIVSTPGIGPVVYQ